MFVASTIKPDATARDGISPLVHPDHFERRLRELGAKCLYAKIFKAIAQHVPNPHAEAQGPELKNKPVIRFRARYTFEVKMTYVYYIKLFYF